MFSQSINDDREAGRGGGESGGCMGRGFHSRMAEGAKLNRPFDSFAKPRMRISLLGTFRVKHRVETMGVAGVYGLLEKRKGLRAKRPRARLRNTELLLLCAVLG